MPVQAKDISPKQDFKGSPNAYRELASCVHVSIHELVFFSGETLDVPLQPIDMGPMQNKTLKEFKESANANWKLASCVHGQNDRAFYTARENKNTFYMWL